MRIDVCVKKQSKVFELNKYEMLRTLLEVVHVHVVIRHISVQILISASDLKKIILAYTLCILAITYQKPDDPSVRRSCKPDTCKRPLLIRF